MENIKISMAAARVNAEMTQNELASKMGVSKVTIIKWEKGVVKPKPAQFYMFCMLCGLPVDNVILPNG